MSPILELRRAVRSLIRDRAITGLAVLALGLGLGLPTAMFGLVDAAVLRGLPVDEPDELYHLERRRAGDSGEGMGAAARDYLGWIEQQRSFEALAAYSTGTVTLRSDEAVDRRDAARLTAGAFAVMRTSAALGRVFEEDEAAAVIGDALWRDRFAADPAVLGRTVWVDGAAHTIVGVMPPSFRFPAGQDIWLPFAIRPGDAAADTLGSFGVFGRLREGASEDDARAEFAVIASRMAERYPDTNRGLEITVKTITERFIGETATASMFVMLAGVMLVLVVACTNVSNLLLVRAVHRVREMAIQSALGGSRSRVVGSVLLESLVVAAAGTVLAIGVAALAMAGADRVFAGRLPYWVDLRLDGSALLFMLGMAALAAFLAGVLPAFRATRADLTSLLRDTSRGGTSLRLGRVMHGLVSLQVALSLALLVGTGLMLRSMLAVRAVAGGLAGDDTFTARFTMPDDWDDDARRRFTQGLLSALAAEPGAADVAVATTLPADRASSPRVAVEGVVYDSEDDIPRARFAAVSPSFFQTFAVAAVGGRLFAAPDAAAGDPVAIVNRRFAERFFAGRDPVGRRIRIGTSEQEWRRVVGVVPDLWMAGFDASGDRNPAGVYVPVDQAAPASLALAVRVRAGDPLAFTTAARGVAFRLDPDVPLYEVRSMPGLIVDNSWFYGLGAAILGTSGLAALVLAFIGLYGVIAFNVRRRTREIGIRMAIGADPATILRLIVRRGGLQILIGFAFGLPLALLLAGGVSSLLFQVAPTDPLVIGANLFLLAAVGIAASIVPAIRAARVRPLVALNAD